MRNFKFDKLSTVDIININTLNTIFNDEIYLVGGCVRDSIIGKKPKDIDFATKYSPDEIIAKLLEYDKDITIIEVGKSFGVIKVILLFQEYEIATFRQDTSEGRKPTVEFSSMEKDVERRDFKMNGLFAKFNNKYGTFSIIDLCGGIKDIENKMISCIGNPADRFREDELRKLRCIRFHATFNYDYDISTYAAIFHNPTLNGVSKERIREEWNKALNNKNCNHYAYINSLFTTKLIYEMFDMEGIRIDEVTHSLPYDNGLFALYNIFRNNKIEDIKKIMQHLTFNNDEINDIVNLFNLLKLISSLNEENFNLIRKINFKLLNRTEILKFTNAVHSVVVNRILDWKPTISGDDLIAEGLKGSEIGIEMNKREFIKFRNS